MKALLIIILLPLSVFSQQWSLIWADEFNGTTLNTNKWVHEIGTGTWGWGNNELQYYTDSQNNIFVDTGYLHIVGRQENIASSSYTSARIKTQGLFDFTYGRVEARIKVPLGQGLWPAFWMLGSNIATDGWPLCGEIDIMEHVNNELKVYGTIHHDMWGHVYEGEFVYTDASIFHEYAIEWDTDEIRWYLDDVEFFSTNIGAGTVSREEFHNPFFLLLNLAIGGNWPGSPDGTTTFPATMMVDYVRVYQEWTGIDEIADFEVSVYPNPANDLITITSEYDFESYSITSLQGEVLLEGKEAVIDIRGLNQGIYFVNLKYSDGLNKRISFVKS